MKKPHGDLTKSKAVHGDLLNNKQDKIHINLFSNVLRNASAFNFKEWVFAFAFKTYYLPVTLHIPGGQSITAYGKTLSHLIRRGMK